MCFVVKGPITLYPKKKKGPITLTLEDLGKQYMTKIT